MIEHPNDVETLKARVKELLEPIKRLIRARMHAQKLMYADETGMGVAGKLHWLHTASNAEYTHLFNHTVF